MGEMTRPSPQLESLKIELHSLWNSRSWRLLRPLRNIARRRHGLSTETEPEVTTVEDAARAIEAIHRSLSWKMTTPLRMVHSVLVPPPPPPPTAEEIYTGRLRAVGPLIDRYAKETAVSPAIHPTDHIFRYILEHSKKPTDEERVQHYFEDGANSARQLAEIVHKYCGNLERKPQLLEFASGYGCVTRHLAKEQTFEAEACDIHPAAIEFIQNTLGVRAVQSAALPEMFEVPHQYDVVFALSFFSHMPITTWARWLVRLTQCVRPGGVIAFTTHGAATIEAHRNPEIGPLGFWFSPSSEQSDLSTEEYGSTIALESFVRKNIQSIPFVELAELRPAYWWNFQDLWILRKTR